MFLTFISTNKSLRKLRNNIYGLKVFKKGLYILGILSLFIGSILSAYTPASPPDCKPEIFSSKVPVKFELDANGNKKMDAAALASLGFATTCDGSAIKYSSDPAILTCADLTRTSIKFIADNSHPNPIAVTFTVPTDVVTDAAGNIYVADGYGCSIRKMATDGTVTAFAGSTGACGYADGKGTAAQFNVVYGITIDLLGNLYVVDDNDRVRKITPDGTTTTLAGSGENKTEDGTGAAASFHDPHGITIDADGNLYITQNDFLIRKVTPSGVVTTITPPPSVSGLNTPIGITVDAAGNLYVTDYSSAIKKIAPDSTITTIAGHVGSGFTDGTGAAASFNLPKGIIMDKDGNLYVTDSQNNAIRKITPSGVVTTLPLTMASTGAKATLNNPIGIKIDPSGNLIVVDSDNERIVRITTSGELTVIAGNGELGSRNGNTNDPPMLGGVSFEIVPISVVSSANTTAAPGGKPTLISFPLNATVCVGGKIEFAAIPASGTIVNSIQWQVNGINVGTNDLNYADSNFQEGDKVTCTVADNSSCTVPQTSDPTIVHIIPSPEIVFNGNPTIPLGGGVTLDPEIDGDIKALRWSPAIGLNSITLKNPVAHPSVTTTYYLTVTSSAGCETTLGVTVNVITPINIPNTFTPNGDGINDLWIIKDLANYPDCVVDIFNRYGQTLFHSRGYGKPWDGAYNGTRLPPGTYYYMITLQAGIKPVSGWIAILQ
ncbi:MAG: Gliding motility-associated C-terminal protein [Mucilaginibacter sp.]|nr:Gliding motility-associated C-terminal protein [Mucilaginibacter sp.]